MTSIAITAPADVTVENFLEAARNGRVKFHTVRANGTTRRVQFYADGTKPREEADWVQEQRDEGRTMRDIAAELHLSVPSVRRMLNALALAEEVEGYEPEELEELLAEAVTDQEATSADQGDEQGEAAPEADPEPAVDASAAVEPLEAEAAEVTEAATV